LNIIVLQAGGYHSVRSLTVLVCNYHWHRVNDDTSGSNFVYNDSDNVFTCQLSVAFNFVNMNEMSKKSYPYSLVIIFSLILR